MTKGPIDDLNERIASLSPAKRALLELMREKRGASFPGEQPALKRSNRDSAPLSFAQGRLWFLNQLDPDNPFYNMSRVFRLKGTLDVRSLQQALNEIIRRHESLRTRVITVAGEPVQVIAATGPIAMAVVDLSELLEAGRETEADRLAAAEAQKPFDLASGPLARANLLRLSENEHTLLLTMHHIISDGWSVAVLLKEMTTLYEAFSSGMPSTLPELPVQYADYAVWQREWLKEDKLEKQLSYWKRQLKEAPAVLDLPTDRPRPATQSFRGARQSVLLPKSLAEGLKQLSQREEVTLFMTLLAAFQTLLFRYTGQTDIVVGSPIAGRNRTELEGLIGFFVNTLVLRTGLSGKLSFLDLLKRIKEVALGAYAHQDLPFDMLVEELQPDRSLSHNPLFQVMFALQNAPARDVKVRDLTFSSGGTNSGRTRFDLEAHLLEKPSGLLCSFVYSTDLFDRSTIARMMNHFQNLLEAILADPEQHLSKFPLLEDEERRQLLIEWNETATDYPRHECVHQLFEVQAARTPEAIALVLEGETVTYKELNRRANQLAHHLENLGAGPESLVGVFLERSVDMVVALLAVLKAGAAYLPIDVTYPKERLAFMLEDSEVPLLLTQERLVERLPASPARLIRLDADREILSRQNEQNPINRATAENLAYVMYTSGSTGKPKGVSVTHRGIARLVKETNYVSLTADDVFLQYAPVSFDAATFEVWGSLLNGARLVIAPARMSSLSELGEIIQRNRVTTLWLTSRLFQQVVEGNLESLKHVRQLLAGGDVLPAPQVRKAIKELKQCRLINGYGPTENTTFTCCYPMTTASEVGASIPIGRPIANTQVYILDTNLEPVPVGVAGELYIGGDGLARGYLNRPELTAEKFIPDRFGKQAGARLYKTGDLCLWTSSGEVEFLGRIDHQVKIRGYRVEVEEIEAVLATHPAVLESVVVAGDDRQGDKRLVAYIVPDHSYQHAQESKARAEKYDRQVSHWQNIFDDLVYKQESAPHDHTFNIIGWNSSYTGLPIPEKQMREWLDDTVERILSLRPRRVLEIGCGTGLLLFRIVPHCDQYFGTDISQVALSYVSEQLKKTGRQQDNITLLHRSAENFEGIGENAFDVIVLNSVAQYFPSVDYLARVLEGAASALAPGGAIFVGDVRSLPLLETLHTSVQLYKAEASLPVERLRQRVQTHMEQENELVIDPRFFTALKQRLAKIGSVEVFPKRGRYHNELTRFRYQVIMRATAEADSSAEIASWDWRKENLSLPALHKLLLANKPAALRVERIPNSRLSADIIAQELLASPDCPQTAGQLREVSQKAEQIGVDPEEFWKMSEELSYALPYAVNISWADHSSDGSYDVVLRRRTTQPEQSRARGASKVAVKAKGLGSLKQYANNPLHGAFARKLVPELRSFLKQKLPDYMVPSVFVAIEALPVSPIGKIDRKSLPAPYQVPDKLNSNFVEPRDPLESQLTQIWEELLGTWPIGIKDDFFELGGHSLLAVSLIDRIEQIYGKRIPLASLYAGATIEHLATALLQGEGDWKSPVIEVQTGGSRRPFFYFHGDPNGGGFYCLNLARYLGKDQPFYAVQPYMKDGQNLPATVEEMAASCLEVLLKYQPEGPYLLGGFCGGGLLAFEVARLLQSQGRKVDMLILIHASATNTRFGPLRNFNKGMAHLLRLAPDEQLDWFVQMRDFILSLNGLTTWEQVRVALKKTRKISNKVSTKLSSRNGDKQAPASTVVPDSSTQVRAARHTDEKYLRYVKAILCYIPKSYAGRIHLLWPSEGKAGNMKDPARDWRKVASGVTVRTIPGGHLTCVTRYVQALAEHINTCLEEAQAGDEGKSKFE